MFEVFIPLLSTAFGAIGALFKAKEERAMKKLELEYQLKFREKDLEELKIEGEIRQKIVETETQAAMELSADRAMEASFTALAPVFKGAKEWWLKAVDAFTQLMRPAITIYLLVMTTYISSQVHTLVKGLTSIPTDDLVSLYKNIIMALISLTMTAVGWWFGSRPTSNRKFN